MKKIFICLVVLILAACLRLEDPVPVVSPQATNTLPPSPTPTATVVWFPPTDTPAATPTQDYTPTPEVLVQLGDVIYEDPFLSSEGWTLPETQRGEINIGNGEMNIIINEPGSYFDGFLDQPSVTNFYAEITTNPILCSPVDEYGFLFSVSGINQYLRLAINCSGEVRLDRLDAGSTTLLFPRTRIASIPAGALSVTRIAVIVIADQIHIYINGDLISSLEGQINRRGSFGVFGRSSGDTAMTVSFSDFVIREVLP
jgi:hypothetical protein